MRTGVSAKVSIGIREALVTALTETGLADNIDSRSLLLSVISDLLDHPLTVPHHAVGRDHLVELINTCAKMERGLIAIVDAVRFLRPGSQESERVRQLVEEPQVVDLLPEADMRRLRTWLTGITSPHLPVLVQRAAGPGVPAIDPSTDAWEAFSYLTDFNAGPTGFPPAMAFLELLAGQLADEEPKKKLTEWNKIQVRRLRLGDELGRLQMTGLARIRADATLHLMIAVQPDGIDQDRFVLSHWRQDDPEQWPPARGDSRTTTLACLEQSIDEVVCGAETAWSARGLAAALEFVLPRRLLNLPVHRWRKEHDSPNPRPLFLDYPIVVRSLERMISARWHRVWRQRWRTLIEDPTMERVFFGLDKETTAHAQLDATLSDQRWALMVLTASPPSDPTPGADELTTALRSGLPALLWHPHASTDLLRSLVTWLAEDSGLGDLPARARASRLAALGETGLPFDANIMQDLVVLWDNPERLAVFDLPSGQPRPKKGPADERAELF